MSHLHTYAATTFAAIAAVALVQPAHASAASSRKLVNEIIAHAENVTENTEQLSEHATTQVAGMICPCLVSAIVKKTTTLQKLANDTGLTKKDAKRLESKVKSLNQRTSAAVDRILETDVNDLPQCVKSALIILAYGCAPDDLEEHEKVVEAFRQSVISTMENMLLLLKNIDDEESAEGLTSIVVKLDYHLNVITGYMEELDESAYEELIEELGDLGGQVFAAMRDLRGESYFDNSELRKFCENRLN